MTSSEIRKSFLDFFHEKQHTIVPSSSLLPDSPNLLFTNAGMNQFVPIFLGQQKPSWKPPRVADTQKCIRAGGKHNDLEDVGLDTYHHTFFEMLGNWSFGDYFKKEAIEWAWELVVERWKLPPQRLYATVYKPGPGEPSEFDQEAYEHWARLFREAELDPAVHVVNGNKADNFWMMGDTGPCGPCSELHVDLTPDGDTRGKLVNAGDPRCIEIWNLVFIQFNANPDGSFVPLPQRHVDTGLGFERATAILQGTKNFTDFSGIVSNYETDIFRPIFDGIEKLSGKKYGSTLPESADRGAHAPSRATVGASPTALGEAPSAAPEAGALPRAEQEKIDIAFRVIADHIRTLSFAIADGIVPSNEGRGYVLRRILRRAVRYGRTLGFHEPFFFQLVDVVAKTMGNVFPDVPKNQSRIKETIKREEESFNKALDEGIYRFGLSISALQVFEESVNRTVVPASLAFELYDTYGFPLDLTELMARERGFTVDVAGFEKLMDEQRSRARAAQKKETITMAGDFPRTDFVGYDKLSVRTRLLAIEGDQTAPGVRVHYAIVKESPLYAAMGGQVGDHGTIKRPSGTLPVVDTVKRGETFFLKLPQRDALGGYPIALGGEEVEVAVDLERRRAIERHHSVTHILHWALHEVVSCEATQKGSYVGPEKLTFDFSSAALTPEQKRGIEKLVNEKVAENTAVSWTEIPYADAKKRSDIQQFFGDKYGETVRVVQIGGDAKMLNGYSMELCGGTHVRSTGEIKSFRIVKEEAIAAGIRRIEAVAGDALIDWAVRESARQQEKFEMLLRKKPDLEPLPDFGKDAKPDTVLAKIDNRAAHLEKLEVEVRDWEKQSAKTAGAELQSRAATIANELAASHATDASLVAEVPDADGKMLGAVVDVLKGKFSGPVFLAGVSDGRVALIASVPKELTSKFQANKLIQEIAPIVGGKGGGRPENAQGAGNDPTKLEAALAKARSLLT
jgi:alanyl-tRNA synthetase